MGKDKKYGAAAVRNYNCIMAQRCRHEARARQKQMRVVTDWSFTWPWGTNRNDCEEHLNNKDLPRLGNNWIDVDDSALTLYVSRNCQSVSVQLRDINHDRVTRVVISDGLKTVCWATNLGTHLVDGDYGSRKN